MKNQVRRRIALGFRNVRNGMHVCRHIGVPNIFDGTLDTVGKQGII